ncbi:MAG: hypothetical protein Q4C98_02440 [Capnocytophaga sp.]|nr:hypothetical protein [Capnocytophaga sp.]
MENIDEFFRYFENKSKPYFNNCEHSLKHRSFDFYKENTKKRDSLFITYLINSKQLYISNTINYNISIEEVNKILSYFIDIQNSNEIVTVKKLPNLKHKEISDLEDKIFKLPNYSLKKEKNLLIVTDILLEYISKSVLTFFSEIQSVQDVNDKILNVLPWDKWSDYIPGKTYYKALIILKLVKSNQYESFYTMYYNRIKDFFDSGMTELSEFLDTLVKLKNYLDENY